MFAAFCSAFIEWLATGPLHGTEGAGARPETSDLGVTGRSHKPDGGEHSLETIRNIIESELSFMAFEASAA